jgi:hypothetical protein
MDATKKSCMKCKKDISENELHKIVIYIVGEKFTEHHYEHVECPDNNGSTAHTRGLAQNKKWEKDE